MYDSSRLHAAFAAAQNQRGLKSMAELGRRSTVTPVSVRAYFAGERNPPLDVCERLGKALGVRGRWLFDGTGPRLPKEQGAIATPSPHITLVSLIDQVTAGKLARPNSQIPIEDVPLLAFADLGSGEFFATRVNGSSMDRISPEGSIIVINRNDKTLVSGRFYVFSHQGETTYKRWQGGDPEYLSPYSTDEVHKPIFIKRKRDLEIIGRVRRTVLDL